MKWFLGNQQCSNNRALLHRVRACTFLLSAMACDQVPIISDPSGSTDRSQDSIELELNTGKCHIRREWCVNDTIVPTVDVDGVDCFIINKAWRANCRVWLNAITGKSTRHPFLTTCNVATTLLAQVERGKPVRRLRRVNNAGQMCTGSIIAQLGDDTVTLRDCMTKVCVEATCSNLSTIITHLSNEYDTRMTAQQACVDSQPRSASCDSLITTPTKPDDGVDEATDALERLSDDESDDELDDDVINVIDKETLPGGVYYATSRLSFVCKRKSVNSDPPTRREFRVRVKAVCFIDELGMQRKRALHFYQTGTVIDEPKIKKNKRVLVDSES